MAVQELRVEVQGGDIVVFLPFPRYTVIYYKPSNSPQLLAKRLPGKDDPYARLTQAEFLARACKLANDKARELGWIV